MPPMPLDAAKPGLPGVSAQSQVDILCTKKIIFAYCTYRAYFAYSTYIAYYEYYAYFSYFAYHALKFKLTVFAMQATLFT